MKLYEIGPFELPFGWVRARSAGEARQKALKLGLGTLLSTVRVVVLKK
jgi:hypothetical protein